MSRLQSKRCQAWAKRDVTHFFPHRIPWPAIRQGGRRSSLSVTALVKRSRTASWRLSHVVKESLPGFVPFLVLSHHSIRPSRNKFCARLKAIPLQASLKGLRSAPGEGRQRLVGVAYEGRLPSLQPHTSRALWSSVKDAGGTLIDPGQSRDVSHVADGSGAMKAIDRENADLMACAHDFGTGPVALGRSLSRRSHSRRDELRDKHKLIGMEMEAAGAMNRIPVGVMRGACDYGDKLKNKEWQPYAAAMAAAYAKAVLAAIGPRKQYNQ